MSHSESGYPRGRRPVFQFLRSWLKGHATAIAIFVAGGVLGAGVLIFSTVIGARDIQQAEDPQAVACDWVRTITALQIYPVYPPSEDFHVGDLIAIRELGKDEVKPCDKGKSKSILFRTVHIAHVPGAETALQNYYKQISQLPLTPEKYDGTSPVIADHDIFTAAGPLKSPPIVAFPAITVATASAQTASAGLLSGVRNFFLGSNRTRSKEVQLKISEAETYGFAADDALRLIFRYCTNNFLCTRDGVRQALSLKDENISINLYLVSRVYLTRSIDYEYGADTAVAAEAAVQEKLKGEPPHLRSAPPSTVNPRQQTQTQSPEQNPEATGTRINQDFGYLAQAGKLTTAWKTSAGVVLRMQLARPVVIGYAAIKFGPFPDIAGPKPG